MSGAQGSSSTGDRGGNGYTLAKTLRLRKGQVLRFEIGQIGGLQTPGQISRGGGKSQLWIDDQLVWIAGGGTGAIPTYDQSTKTVTQCDVPISGGDGASVGSSGYVRYHTHEVGDKTHQTACWNYYGPIYWTHKILCTETAWDDGCEQQNFWAHCEYGATNEGGGEPGRVWVGATHEGEDWDYFWWQWFDCKHYEGDGWQLNCPYTDGQVLAQVNASPGQCYFASGYTPDSQSLLKSGNGSFSIKLCDHYSLSFRNGTVSNLYYLDKKCNLLILDDTVVYYKR